MDKLELARILSAGSLKAGELAMDTEGNPKLIFAGIGLILESMVTALLTD